MRINVILNLMKEWGKPIQTKFILKILKGGIKNNENYSTISDYSINVLQYD